MQILMCIALVSIAGSPGADTGRQAAGLHVSLAPRVEPVRFARFQPALADTNRPRAIEHSNFYYTRLSIHRYASYVTLPLFVTEYFLGQSLFNQQVRGESTEGGTRSAHAAVAGGIAVLFGVNTVTGVWNLVEARHDPGGARRWIHSGLMLAADAGFAWAGATAPGSEDRSGPDLSNRRNKHRAIALTSMGVSAASYLMMLVWKD